MRDEEIRSRLKEQMASIHASDQLCNRTLQQMNGKDEIIVKKKITWVPAIVVLVMIAMIGTALAAGFIWGHPLENELEISNDMKQTHQETGLLSEPSLTQTHDGITISLDQCVADEHTAYISFRISGWKLKEGDEPGFDQAICDLALTGGQSTSSCFISLWSQESQKELFTDENGDLFYCFTISALDDTLPGRNAHVELRGLGHYRKEPSMMIDVDIQDIWTFDWVLAGTTQKQVWSNLSLPIGESEWTLREAAFSPVTAVLLLAPPQGMAIDDMDGQPWFLGIIDENGTEFRLPGGGGTSFTYQEDQYCIKAVESFHKVIDVSNVRSILFVIPDQDNICVVDLPDPLATEN